MKPLFFLWIFTAAIRFYMIFLCILNTFLSLSSFNGCESRQGIYFTHKRGQMFFWSKNFRLHISTKPKNHTHTFIPPMFMFLKVTRSANCSKISFRGKVGSIGITSLQKRPEWSWRRVSRAMASATCDGLSALRDWEGRGSMLQKFEASKYFHHGNLRSIFTWDLYLYSIASCH